MKAYSKGKQYTTKNAHSNENVMKMVFSIRRQGGDRNINLLPLDPLDIPRIHIEQGEESPVNVVLIFTNNTIVGLRDFEFYKIE